MNRVLLYASNDKLKAFEGSPGWLKRIDVGLRVGPPGASVTAELRARDMQALQGMIDRADRSVRKAGMARPLADSIVGRPPSLFRFEGPAGRLADSGVIWFAGVDDGVGFLLAGSSVNAIAQVSEQPGMLSPSADPVGTVQRFFESRADSDRDSQMAVYVWGKVLSSTAQSGGLAAAPWISGTAVYAGRIPIEASSGDVAGAEASAARNLLIGSPLWVAQV